MFEPKHFKPSFKNRLNLYWIKSICLSNSVCAIFSLSKQGTFHKTYQSSIQIPRFDITEDWAQHCFKNEWTLVPDCNIVHPKSGQGVSKEWTMKGRQICPPAHQIELKIKSLEPTIIS